MEIFTRQSIFQDLRARELSGLRVRKCPISTDASPQFSAMGGIEFGDEDEEEVLTPPMALSFCKSSKFAHIVAVSGEDGIIRLYNTQLKFPEWATERENADQAMVSDWHAHHNAIFDICWTKDDTTLMTACGDHSIKLWDPQERTCTGVLTGHTGSVKSICAHPFNNDIVLSGSRDGTFALWDLRNSRRKLITMIHGAHASSTQSRVKLLKATSMSITSVLYLKDEVTVATAGAADSVIKLWDTRNLQAPVMQIYAHDKRVKLSVRPHGICSLSQDENGEYITASSTDSRIYLFNALQLDKGCIKSFEGCDICTFFVKTKLSPDGSQILSGSSDGNAYVWQVNKSEADPIKLKGHDGEVTAVDWSSSEVGKIATSADDGVVRLWDINRSCYSYARPPACNRRRVIEFPKMKCRKVFSEEKESSEVDPPTEMKTPESVRRQSTSCDRSPEATLGSPSSVLNPPPSLKRKTILDYFVPPS